jgi:hypothetical protein
MDPNITSFEGQFLVLLQERLAELVPEIRYINWDLGQLEMEDPPVSWPCLLVDISDTQYADLSNGIQEANPCTIVLRLGFAPFSSTSNLRSEAIRAKGNYNYELEDKIYRCLQGWMCDDLCSPLTRVRKITEKREVDIFRVRPMIFTTAFQDDGAKPSTHKMHPPINLDIAFGQIEEEG